MKELKWLKEDRRLATGVRSVVRGRKLLSMSLLQIPHLPTKADAVKGDDSALFAGFACDEGPPLGFLKYGGVRRDCSHLCGRCCTFCGRVHGAGVTVTRDYRV
jgi:hypothetical protein